MTLLLIKYNLHFNLKTEEDFKNFINNECHLKTIDSSKIREVFSI